MSQVALSVRVVCLVGKDLELQLKSVAEVLNLGCVTLPLVGADPCGPDASEAPAQVNLDSPDQNGSPLPFLGRTRGQSSRGIRWVLRLGCPGSPLPHRPQSNPTECPLWASHIWYFCENVHTALAPHS